MDALFTEMLKELRAIRQQKQQQDTAAEWKLANPYLSKQCGLAFDKLAQIQNEFVEQLVNEVADLEVHGEDMYMLREFTERFGNVSTQLNNVMNTLKFLRS